jgi:hypothetical protein
VAAAQSKDESEESWQPHKRVSCDDLLLEFFPQISADIDDHPAKQATKKQPRSPAALT